MPEIKISEMTEAVTLTDEDLVPIVQGDLNKKANVKQLRQYNNLHDRPTINNVVLEGEKNLEDLKLIKAGSGIETATDNSLKLEELTAEEIKTHSKKNTAVAIKNVDDVAMATTHQNMADTYNANEDPLIKNGEKQPVAYKAVKDYIDTNDTEILAHVAAEDEEIMSHIATTKDDLTKYINTQDTKFDTKFTKITDDIETNIDLIEKNITEIEIDRDKTNEENLEKFNTGALVVEGEEYLGITSEYGATIHGLGGNYEQGANPTPEQPQEIKSVEISKIISTGKNIYNNDFIEISVDELDVSTMEKDGWIKVNYNNTTTTVKYLNFFHKINNNLKKNTKYHLMIQFRKIAISGDVRMEFMSTEDNVNSGQFTSSVVIVPISDTSYIRELTTLEDYSSSKYLTRSYFDIQANSSLSCEMRIMLSETPYTEFEVANTPITTSLEVPLALRSLPNGVRDTYENGLITRQVGYIEFDGSPDENWIIDITGDVKRFKILTNNSQSHVIGAKRESCLSNRFKQNLVFTNNVGDCFMSNGLLYVVTDQSITTVEQFKTWLQTHKTEVWYQLATPIEETISLSTIPTFPLWSSLYHDSPIPTNDFFWGINTKINGSYTKDEVYNRVEMDNELSKMARSGDIIPLGAEIRIGEDDLVPEEYELVEEIYNAEEVVMNNGITVESAITELQTSGLRVADPSPIGTQIVYEGPANMIPSNYKVVEPAFSNPNLLINGDFQVNQRHDLANGKDFNNGYVMDRWVLSSNNKICTVKATIKENDISFVRVTAKEATGLITLLNPLELSEKLIQLVKERKLTLSMMIRASKKSAYHYKANEIIEIGTEWKVVECEYSFDEYFVDLGAPRLNVYVGIKDIDILTNPTAQLNAGDYFDISWAKLELGELATPFIPRSYSEELLLCQRYYERQFVTTDTYNKNTGGTELYLLQGFSPKTEKRAMPTITITDRGGNVGYCTRDTFDKQPVRVYLGYGINNFEMISDDGVLATQIMAWVTMDAEIY